MTGRTVVIGLGNLERGDDAIGPLVARAVCARTGPDVVALATDDPLELLDACEGTDRLVVVDAMVSGATPGTVRLGHPDDLRLSDRLRPDSTHVLSPSDVLGLARSLHRLPDRTYLVGVEASSFDEGAPLSRPVAEALRFAVDACVRLVSRGEGSDVHR